MTRGAVRVVDSRESVQQYRQHQEQRYQGEKPPTTTAGGNTYILNQSHSTQEIHFHQNIKVYNAASPVSTPTRPITSLRLGDDNWDNIEAAKNLMDTWRRHPKACLKIEGNFVYLIPHSETGNKTPEDLVRIIFDSQPKSGDRYTLAVIEHRMSLYENKDYIHSNENNLQWAEQVKRFNQAGQTHIVLNAQDCFRSLFECGENIKYQCKLHLREGYWTYTKEKGLHYKQHPTLIVSKLSHSSQDILGLQKNIYEHIRECSRFFRACICPNPTTPVQNIIFSGDYVSALYGLCSRINSDIAEEKQELFAQACKPPCMGRLDPETLRVFFPSLMIDDFTLFFSSTLPRILTPECIQSCVKKELEQQVWLREERNREHQLVVKKEKVKESDAVTTLITPTQEIPCSQLLQLVDYPELATLVESCPADVVGISPVIVSMFLHCVGRSNAPIKDKVTKEVYKACKMLHLKPQLINDVISFKTAHEYKILKLLKEQIEVVNEVNAVCPDFSVLQAYISNNQWGKQYRVAHNPSQSLWIQFALSNLNTQFVIKRARHNLNFVMATNPIQTTHPIKCPEDGCNAPMRAMPIGVHAALYAPYSQAPEYSKNWIRLVNCLSAECDERGCVTTIYEFDYADPRNSKFTNSTVYHCDTHNKNLCLDCVQKQIDVANQAEFEREQRALEQIQIETMANPATSVLHLSEIIEGINDLIIDPESTASASTTVRNVDGPFCLASEIKMSECAICLSTGKDYYVTPCNHTFHKECIDKWFERSQTHSCPACKREVKHVLEIPKLFA